MTAALSRRHEPLRVKIDGRFVRELVNDPLDAAALHCFAVVARVLHRPAPLDELLQPAPAVQAA